jgi:hypothetical protein
MRQELQKARIGDVERDEAIDQLSDHFAAGRLDRDEFDERSAAVLCAKTQSELDSVFFDLPGPSRPTRTVNQTSRPASKIIASVVCAGVAIVAVLLGVSSHPEVPAMPVSVCDSTVQENCVWPDELVEDLPR